MTVAGARHDLPKPFHVLATQNPIEQEGTYPLPEAQLDRFLMKIDVDYPDRDAERRILVETTGVEEAKAEGRNDRRRPDRGAAPGAPAAGRRVRGRSDPRAGALGASGPRRRRPRQADRLGTEPARLPGADARARARALLDGRLAPSIDDVIALAEPVLKHRMALTFAARADGETITGVIGKLAARLG